MEGQDRPLLPVFEPPVAWDECIVLVGQAIAFPPVVKLALGDSEPGDEPMDGELGAFGPVVNVVNHGVADVVGNPGFGQSSPCSFFS
jgi:hypothetical protein